MLLELRLRNLAIAADVVLELSEGLNVLTGSTGAGKSLVVTALQWLRGEAVDRDLVREGTQVASAEALFDLHGRPRLREELGELGVEIAGDEILRLKREVRSGGRSRAYVGTQLSSASVLAAITDHLIELQSQHQQLRLLDPAGHSGLLDQAGVDPACREAYREALRHTRRIQTEIETWKQRQEQLRQQQELLEFQLRELEAARLAEGEMLSLRATVARMAGGAKLMENAHRALEWLEGEESGALSALGHAAARLRELPEEVEELREAGESVQAALDLANESAHLLGRFVVEEDFDPQALDKAQGRLSMLEQLCRKYGRTESELLSWRDRLREELHELEHSDELPARLRDVFDSARAALETSAKALHQQRSRQARRVASEAGALLSDLGMPEAALRFDLEPHDDPQGEIRLGAHRVHCHPDGPARVRLRVRTNPGEPFGPVERMASGGELSRLGLVLRSLSLRPQRPALVILDEVDTGLGADLGPALARRLRALADQSQLLVISHLPAVAAAADRHLAASKGAEDGRTLSRVDELDEEGRIEELARMLGGPGHRARALARQLRRSIQGAARLEEAGS